MSEDASQIVKIGKVRDAHGIRGDLYILIFSGDLSWLEKLTWFILKNPKTGLESKFTVTHARPHKDGFIVKTKEISNRNQSELLKQQDFYIPVECVTSAPGETIFLHEILNFEVFSDGKKLGLITEFSSNGIQDLLVVKADDGKIGEIPFVDDFIVNIDFENRKIDMDIPDGLFDLESTGKES